MALARVGVDIHVEEPTIQPGIEITLVESARLHKRLQHDFARVSKDDFAVLRLLAREATFVNQVMMVPAEKYEILQAGLAAVCPVDNVMAIHETIVVAAWKSAAAVSE